MRFKQFVKGEFEIGDVDWFGEASRRSVCVSKCGTMTRVARGNDDDWQFVTAGVKCAEQGYRMTITAVDYGNVKIRSTLAANLKSMIDVVPDKNFRAAFLQRFSDDFFKTGVMSKQESEADIHFCSSKVV